MIKKIKLYDLDKIIKVTKKEIMLKLIKEKKAKYFYNQYQFQFIAREIKWHTVNNHRIHKVKMNINKIQIYEIHFNNSIQKINIIK